MEYILLIIAIFLGSFRTVLTKIVNKGECSFYKKAKTNAYMFIFAFIAVFLIGIGSLKTMFAVPWWLTVVYAVSMVLAQVCLMKAVELGPVSTSTLIYNCGFIISMFFGSIYYRERVHALHIIGVLLILISFLCSVKQEDKKISPLWFIMAFGGFLFSGLLGVWQKIFRYEYSTYLLDNFIQVAFLLMVVFSFGILLLLQVGKDARNQGNTTYHDEEKVVKKPIQSKWIKVGLIVALGAIMGLINKMNTFLSGVLPSVVVFPCNGGGGIIVTTVLSMFLFKEKLSKLQTISLLVGILGIISISVGTALV